MNPPENAEEPLNNSELESAILGLRMTLTEEEASEARQKLLAMLPQCMLAVPTTQPVKTTPEGQIAPDAEISFVVLESKEGVNGIAAFTNFTFMKSVLPQSEHGVFLNGVQIASMVSNSPYPLFLDGPDVHAELSTEELKGIVDSFNEMMQRQQAAMEHNKTLEDALTALKADETEETKEATAKAFLEGFCRVPLPNENEKDAKVVLLRVGDQNNPQQQQEIPLLTADESLLCFTSEEAMGQWSQEERQAVALPGPMIADLVARTGVSGVTINSGNATEKLMKVEKDRLMFV